jgi:hypothetical protein
VPQTKSGLNIKGNVRSLQLINDKHIIAGVNNGAAVLLKINGQ